MSNESQVSVIIPTYKRSDRIARAIESVLQQEYTNFEVIVVDDNDPATDERKKTEKAVEKYKIYNNFIYIKHSENRNGSVARNTGINASSGKYITFLDDDDEYFPNKIKEQAQVLDSLSDEWALCYSKYKKIDQYGNTQTSSETAEGDVLVKALTKNLFLGSGSNFMVRKSVVNEVNGFNETFKRNQDLEFLVRIVANYKMKFVDSVGILIHNEIRENKYSYEEIKEINNNYRLNFRNVINSLNIDSRNKVLKTLDLWDIRYAFTYGRVCDAIKIIWNSELTLIEICRFTGYIVKRFLTKKSYGFEL